MKKFFASVLALTLALSLSVTAFAADTTINPGEDGSPTPGTAKTSVEFGVAPTYTITIPGTVELKEETDTNTGAVTYKQDAEIIASAGVRLLNGQSIQVTLSAGEGETEFVLTTDQDATLDYTVTVGEGEDARTIASGDTVAAFGTSPDAQESTLHFSAADPTYAGDYSDTVVFTISIVTQTSTGSGESAEP